jgi:hypothetical protein
MSKLSKLWDKICAWFDKLIDKIIGCDTDDANTTIHPSWIYGGVNAINATEVTGTTGYKLTNVTFDRKNIRFSGVGSMWGTTHDKPDARNCLFFKENGKWYGGFFEWGSPDRTTRAINNITSGYKGWDANRLLKATEFAFCICNKAGTQRSNYFIFKA